VKSPWRIALVVPRYGEDVLGGAEALARGLAEQLVASGLARVEVLTTCARDHFTWQNELPAGTTVLNRVPVRRFQIARTSRNIARYDALHSRLIQGEVPPIEEQYAWVDHSAHSPALYAYLEQGQGAFDFFVFVPYLFGTTYYGSAIHPAQSVLWLCLHDEIYAYLDPTREMYRTCKGVMFNTYPEARLAERLYGSHPGAQIVGFGMSPIQASAERFRRASGLSAPFILYSGRLEGAKNVPLLIQYFLEYKRQRGGELKLVLMGRGPEPIPRHRDIVNIGFKQGQAKLDAYAAATILCQPSVNESFSIVIMEAWQCQVPVLVHADCPVTVHHTIQSNGGLYFRDYDEFESVIDLILNDEPLRQRLGRNGQAYVQTKFNWARVLQRFDAALSHWSAAV
jgi:glycosyltransferase involved in cell wall biosynthesis